MALVIVADDVTGAADSAARCHYAGLPATIYLRPTPPPWPSGAIAFSTDSRFLPPAEAAAQVRRLLAPLKGAPAIWYKKIDSTLRGNLGAELDAMLTELHRGETTPVAAGWSRASWFSLRPLPNDVISPRCSESKRRDRPPCWLWRLCAAATLA